MKALLVLLATGILTLGSTALAQAGGSPDVGLDNESEATSPECTDGCNTNLYSHSLTEIPEHLAQARARAALGTTGTAKPGSSSNVAD